MDETEFDDVDKVKYEDEDETDYEDKTEYVDETGYKAEDEDETEYELIYNIIIHKGLSKPYKTFSKIEYVRVTFINCHQKEEAASDIRSGAPYKNRYNKLSIITMISQMFFCTICQKCKL